MTDTIDTAREELCSLNTVQYWAREFAKDPQQMAGGMIVKLLNEYASLRAQLAAQEQAKQSVERAELIPHIRTLAIAQKVKGNLTSESVLMQAAALLAADTRPALPAEPLSDQQKPIITLSGHHLRGALNFLCGIDCAKDETPELLELLEQEVCIQHGPARTDDEGGDPEGLYCWLEEYPEEGSISLEPLPPAPQGEQG